MYGHWRPALWVADALAVGITRESVGRSIRRRQSATDDAVPRLRDSTLTDGRMMDRANNDGRVGTRCRN